MHNHDQFGKSRRKFIGVVAASSIAPAMWTSKTRAASQVIVRTPGGVFDDIKRQAIYEPFQKETGIEVVPVAATPAKLMAMMKSGQGGIDVIDIGDNTLIELERNGFLRAIDYDNFRYTDPGDLDPAARRPNILGNFIYAMVLGYNSQAVPQANAPKSWGDFWNVDRFPGRRTFPDMSTGMTSLEFALIADGVPPERLYPLDIPRAFKSLSRIRSSIPKFWDSGALSTNMLVDKEVALGAVWSTRISAAIDQGAPLGIQWNQNALLVQAYAIPKSAPNLANAKTFVDWSSSVQAQTRWLSKYKAIPVNTQAYGAMSADLIDPATNKPWTRSKGFVTDMEWWAQNRATVATKWSQWLLT